ncbi:MAG: hypothetical protein ABIR57_12395 [Aeromicrobium sp.]
MTIYFADGRHRTIPFKRVLPDSGLNADLLFKSAFYKEKFAANPRTVAWLRKSLAAHFPGQAAAKMVVEWQRLLYRESESWRPNRRTVRTVTVQLDQP